MIKEMQVLFQAVREAGSAILNLQQTGFSKIKKPNGDWLTKADTLSNEILQTQLLQAFPNDGWLSEESVDNQERLFSQRVWIVDPIDGTREYAMGLPEYAISVALVEKEIPTLAAIFNPVTDELFYAIKNQGAFLNNEKIYCKGKAKEDLLLLASRTEYQRGEWQTFAVQHSILQMGSIAYKLALIAAGRAQATFSLRPKNEWDIAAGTLLVIEAGGIVLNKQKQELCFNQKEVKVNGIVASAAENNEHIFSLIGEI